MAKQEPIPPHPRPQVEIPLPVTTENVRQVMEGCSDFAFRELYPLGRQDLALGLCWMDGTSASARIGTEVMKPLSESPQLTGVTGREELLEQIRHGAVWGSSMKLHTEMDSLVIDLIRGCAILIFDPEQLALAYELKGGAKRDPAPPEAESIVKGSKEAFVEDLRVNTSLLRRKLRTPQLKIKETLVGRRSKTQVALVHMEGLTRPELVEELARRVDDIDIDGLLAPGDVEEYLVDGRKSAFPRLLVTERSDRFCQGLLEGRVGFLADGLPLGWLAPGDIGQFLRAPQDRSANWLTASILRFLRYAAMLLSLVLPGFYVAAAGFHPELIPTQLALAIARSKLEVPFSAAVEVLIILLAFEILQEAGLRMPRTIGQTVSIIGGLVVGQSAVEARIVSPAVVIVVAIAGICGYTMPDQDFAGALRIWRFAMALAAAVAGLFGLMAVFLALLYHLATLESFGEGYLTPFGSRQELGYGILRPPLPEIKLREAKLGTLNRRRQR